MEGPDAGDARKASDVLSHSRQATQCRNCDLTNDCHGDIRRSNNRCGPTYVSWFEPSTSRADRIGRCFCLSCVASTTSILCDTCIGHDRLACALDRFGRDGFRVVLGVVVTPSPNGDTAFALAVGIGWPLTAIFGVLLVTAMKLIWEPQPLRGPFCQKCDFFLLGLSESRCPECGRPFTLEEIRVNQSDLFSDWPRFDEAIAHYHRTPRRKQVANIAR